MRPEDVYELVNVGDPRISPDGSRVAYTVTAADREANDYTSAIWVAPLDGSAEPQQYTAGEKRDTTPRWSPDGKWLAFASTRGEDKAPAALYLLPAEGGEARKLTDQKESVEAIEWSPDSTRIAFTARVRDAAYDEEDDRKREPRRFTRIFHKLDSVGWTGDRRKHVFVVGIDGGDARQLTSGDFEHGSPAWSPDGKQLVFDGLRDERWDTELINRLYVVDAAGGEPRALTGDGGSYESPAFSPDGSRIAFRMVRRGRHVSASHAARRDERGRQRREAPDDVARPPVRPVPRLPRADLGRRPSRLHDRGRRQRAPLHRRRRRLRRAGAARRRRAGDRRVRPASTGSSSTPRRRTRRCASSTQGRKARSARRSAARSPRDASCSSPSASRRSRRTATRSTRGSCGRPDFEPGTRYPAILTIHGGPFTQYGTGFFDEFQVMASGGYVVLFSNPRGGSGYSEEHGRAIRGPVGDAGPGWGTRDYEDVMAVVDTALEKFDFIDADRLGVIGGSYGGYMTSWIVGHTNRFKAAISERAVNNLLSMFGSSDLFWVFERQFGGTYWDNVEAFIEKSPSTYAKDMETPVLVLHSEQDLRCNIEQGEHLFTLLRLLGKEVEMLRFPAESHELTRARLAAAPRHPLRGSARVVRPLSQAAAVALTVGPESLPSEGVTSQRTVPFAGSGSTSESAALVTVRSTFVPARQR